MVTLANNFVKFWTTGWLILRLILLITFIKDANKIKHNSNTGHFFIFSSRFIQSKPIDIPVYLSLNKNICLVLIRSTSKRHF